MRFDGGQHRDRRIGEELGVALDLHHVGVLGDGPELGELWDRHPQDRLLGPDPRRRRVPGHRVGVGRRIGEDRAQLLDGRAHPGPPRASLRNI
jgi:hypothetical protein